MSWFKRVKEGIATSTSEKKETPEGLWTKCPECAHRFTSLELEENRWVCSDCGYHFRINSREYFQVLFDGEKYKELFADIVAADPLKFVGKKPYAERIEEARKKSGLDEAVRCATGKVHGHEIVCACMDFGYVGGSMSSAVGEKIARAIDYAREEKRPMLIISKSGGARMMEAAFSLMQMAKTSAKLAQLDRAGIPYISLLTDPTTGGVTASFAMLGDLNISEPGALIGFAGPRVIKETIGRDLPKGFQSAEFLVEKGFLDFIVDRRELKEKLWIVLNHLGDQKKKKKKAS